MNRRYGFVRPVAGMPGRDASSTVLKHPAKSGATISIPFATAEGLPNLPQPDLRLRSVKFRSCPGSDLTLRVVRDNNPTRDGHGVPKDAWWVVSCADLPDRTTRLTQGSHSLKNLLVRYGFLDASGCVNHKAADAEYESGSLPLPPHVLRVPQHLVNATGVPQFYPTSGVCWYAALCWSSFANPKLREFLTSHFPSNLRPLCASCLFSRDDAEALRKRLWYDYAVGDDVEDRPENDGRNGFTEFSVLCAKLGVPLVRYQEDQDCLVPMSTGVRDRKGKTVHTKPPKAWTDPHLLVLRYQDGNHSQKHPIQRRVMHKGQRYKLVGLYLGHRKCGHQIGASSPSGNWRDWSLGDADLHKSGIGPIYVQFHGKEWLSKWWQAWRELVHVTKFGAGNRELCNFSWHNPNDKSLDHLRGASSASSSGTLSIDVVYMNM